MGNSSFSNSSKRGMRNLLTLCLWKWCAGQNYSTHSHAQFASLNSLPGIKGVANELGDEEEVSCLFVQGCRQGGTIQRYDITENKKKFPHSKCVELVRKA